MEQRPDYTNVLFQDAQDPWEDFQSLLPTDSPRHSVATPASPAASTSQRMSEADEAKYQQAEAYLDKRQRRRHKWQYEKDTGDVSPSRYPSTPWSLSMQACDTRLSLVKVLVGVLVGVLFFN